MRYMVCVLGLEGVYTTKGADQDLSSLDCSFTLLAVCAWVASIWVGPVRGTIPEKSSSLIYGMCLLYSNGLVPLRSIIKACLRGGMPLALGTEICVQPPVLDDGS